MWPANAASAGLPKEAAGVPRETHHLPLMQVQEGPGTRAAGTTLISICRTDTPARPVCMSPSASGFTAMARGSQGFKVVWPSEPRNG